MDNKRIFIQLLFIFQIDTQKNVSMYQRENGLEAFEEADKYKSGEQKWRRVEVGCSQFTGWIERHKGMQILCGVEFAPQTTVQHQVGFMCKYLDQMVVMKINILRVLKAPSNIALLNGMFSPFVRPLI